MLGFANSAQQRQNGFVGRGNCFVAAVPTKPSRANTRHFNALGERLKAPAKTLRPRSINLASAAGPREASRLLDEIAAFLYRAVRGAPGHDRHAGCRILRLALDQ